MEKANPQKQEFGSPSLQTVPACAEASAGRSSLPNTCFFCQRTRISMTLLD